MARNRSVASVRLCLLSPLPCLRNADVSDLGGWLLTEPWIKPSLYKAANQANGLVVDEVRQPSRHHDALADTALTVDSLPIPVTQGGTDAARTPLGNVRPACLLSAPSH